MSLTRFVLPGLMLGLVLSLVPSVAKAGVVFGNLGSSGTSPSSVGGTGWTVTSGELAAVGFNTGTATFGTLTVNSITLGLAGVPVPSQSVSIYASTGSGTAAQPTGAALFTTTIAPTNPVGSLWTFSFSANSQQGAQLAASTNYWVVLNYVGSNIGWNQGSPFNQTTTPGVQNSSTYSSISGFTRSTYDNRVTWDTGFATQRLSVSINAVPEPSTYAMAGIGAGILGLFRLRRRMK